MSHLLRQALHEEHKAAFSGSVVRMTFPWDDVVNGTDEDQLAASIRDGAIDPLTFKCPDRLAGAKKHSCQVDIDDFLPLVERHLVDPSVELNGRVGNTDIH